MKKLNSIGKTTNGRPIPIHVDRLVESRLLLNANSGAGKSWALRRILEQTYPSIQQLVIDPEGEFYTLRERDDYLLARPRGHGGDVPADPGSAALLARRLLELGISAILDIYELKPDARRRFVKLFLESLVNAPRKLWHPALVVIDEAHAFAPEKGPDEARSAVIDLCARGRKRGFAALLATQRLSKLAKDAAAECNNLLLGRAALDVDLRRVADLLGVTKKEWAQIRQLRAGDFFAFGPALCDQVELVRVGPVATTHVRAGQRGAPPPPPGHQVQRVISELQDLPEKAAEEARDLEGARAEIRELRRKLKAADRDSPPPDAAQLEAARREGARGAEQALRNVIGQAESHHRERLPLVESLFNAAGKLLDMERTHEIQVDYEATAPPGRRTASPEREPGVQPKARTQRRGSGGPDPVSRSGSPGLPRARQRILDALLWLECVGIAQPSRTQLALWCDVSPSSGGYFNNLGALRSGGLLRYPQSGTVELTDDGRAAAIASDPPTVEEMQEMVCRKVGARRADILRALIEVYPDMLAKEALAEQVGVSPTSGGYFNNLGALRTLGLIDYPEPGYVAALPVLFLED